MKLKRFRVTSFRSIEDSGWIDCDNVTTLVGVNEAGKSNLLLALWKLNPVKGGEINPKSDLPRKLYSGYRNKLNELSFVKAEFYLPAEISDKISDITGIDEDELDIVHLSRNYSGEFCVEFIKNTSTVRKLDMSLIKPEIEKLIFDINTANVDNPNKEIIISEIELINQNLTENSISFEEINKLIGKIIEINDKIPSFKSYLDECKANLDKVVGYSIYKVCNFTQFKNLITEKIPGFVYYANYGNLDSEIYLPHVIHNLKRADLTGSTEAKVRTLRVLFEFVGLNPEEILELGLEPTEILRRKGESREPSAEEILEVSENKKEREILLQSASTQLTDKFKDWWKQGEYRFRLDADGSHFRIWVSDAQRPDEVELEGRSTGLQWFLSFYLVFLVESKEAHEGAILLLDEAGLHLHPLAQKDLILFFDNLSKNNQVIHTTHSPFLIDTNHIDRAKSVYVNDKGYTVSSNDLRASERDKKQSRSVYAIYAALGLTTSEVLFQGCHLVIVEGPSDQIYLHAIKLTLISQSFKFPSRELVFVPSGGVKGIQPISSILSGTSTELPIVFIDSDRSGQDFKNKLAGNLYKDSLDKIIEVKDITGIDLTEVEDLIPFEYLDKGISRIFRDIEQEYDFSFAEQYNPCIPIVPQIEKFANHYSVELENGWKVDLAKQAKQRLLQNKYKSSIDADALLKWQKLFNKLILSDS